jgi:hypothetical protein
MSSSRGFRADSTQTAPATASSSTAGTPHCRRDRLGQVHQDARCAYQRHLGGIHSPGAGGHNRSELVAVDGFGDFAEPGDFFDGDVAVGHEADEGVPELGWCPAGPDPRSSADRPEEPSDSRCPRPAAVRWRSGTPGRLDRVPTARAGPPGPRLQGAGGPGCAERSWSWCLQGCRRHLSSALHH